MSENTCSWCFIAAFFLTVYCVFAVAEQRDELKAEAVKRGYAEWIVIRENETEFKWKEKQ
jgi:hypothetical protein